MEKERLEIAAVAANAGPNSLARQNAVGQGQANARNTALWAKCAPKVPLWPLVVARKRPRTPQGSPKAPQGRPKVPVWPRLIYFWSLFGSF